MASDLVVGEPVAGGPTWAPGRTRVAIYVPSRTLSTTADTHQLTFDDSTRPTGAMVDQLIADAVQWVQVATGGILHDSVREQASVAAAVWAAASVERGWPEQEQPDASLRRAADLQALAEQLRADVVHANSAAQGGNPADPAVMPVWSFPPPVPHGDVTLP